jgi:glycosyltransferase involved in cell wall biosynthesis
MAESIVRLGSDVALRARLIDQARRDVQDFTWERSLDRMEKLLYRFRAGDDDANRNAQRPHGRSNPA